MGVTYNQEKTLFWTRVEVFGALKGGIGGSPSPKNGGILELTIITSGASATCRSPIGSFKKRV